MGRSFGTPATADPRKAEDCVGPPPGSGGGRNRCNLRVGPDSGHDRFVKVSDRRPGDGPAVAGGFPDLSYCFAGLAGAMAVAMENSSRWLWAFSRIEMAFWS